MGILTDAFIATDTELANAQAEKSVNPIDSFPTVQGKNIAPLMLAILEAIVTEQEDIYALAKNIGKPLYGDEFSEKWIYPFPEKLAARLADMTTAEIARYAIRWAGCQEWHGVNYPSPSANEIHQANAREYLQKLCQLAIQAKGQGKHIYMWISL